MNLLRKKILIVRLIHTQLVCVLPLNCLRRWSNVTIWSSTGWSYSSCIHNQVSCWDGHQDQHFLWCIGKLLFCNHFSICNMQRTCLIWHTILYFEENQVRLRRRRRRWGRETLSFVGNKDFDLDQKVTKKIPWKRITKKTHVFWDTVFLSSFLSFNKSR